MGWGLRSSHIHVCIPYSEAPAQAYLLNLSGLFGHLVPMPSTILQDDLDGIQYFSYGDVVFGVIGGSPTLHAPMFAGPDTAANIVTVKLVAGERPILEWTTNESQMFENFVDGNAAGVFVDGTYLLDSDHHFEVKIEEGKPSRSDFLRRDPYNTAWCCAEAKAFILKDPNTGKTSTYVKLTETLMLECSHNSKGRVHLWRKS